MTEETISVVKAYFTGGKGKGSKIVVIPKHLVKELNIKTGQIFVVLQDEKGRLIYEKIEQFNKRT